MVHESAGLLEIVVKMKLLITEVEKKKVGYQFFFSVGQSASGKVEMVRALIVWLLRKEDNVELVSTLSWISFRTFKG